MKWCGLRGRGTRAKAGHRDVPFDDGGLDREKRLSMASPMWPMSLKLIIARCLVCE